MRRARADRLLASGGADKTVKLWNLDTLDRLRTYRGHRDFISALAFSPNGNMLASASSRRQHPGVVDVVEPLAAPSLWPPRPRQRSCLLAVRAQHIASGGADGQLRIWDLSRGRTLRTITGHTGAVNFRDVLTRWRAPRLGR